MFWNNFVKLCNKTGKSPNGVCADLGYSTAIASKWKKGAAPRDTTLKKIADYFGVEVSALTSDTPEPLRSASTDSELDELTQGLTDEEIEELKRYAAFLLSKRDKK